MAYCEEELCLTILSEFSGAERRLDPEGLFAVLYCLVVGRLEAGFGKRQFEVPSRILKISCLFTLL